MLGLDEMNDTQIWEYRCLSAGVANSAVLTSLLKKEEDAFKQANVAAQRGSPHINAAGALTKLIIY